MEKHKNCRIMDVYLDKLAYCTIEWLEVTIFFWRVFHLLMFFRGGFDANPSIYLIEVVVEIKHKYLYENSLSFYQLL